MRMRKKKNGEKRLAAVSEFLFEPTAALCDPAAAVGMPGAPVYLEIGAGKGGFACQMAARHKDVAYFAMERVTDCVVLAAERAAKEGGLPNLRFIVDTADNLTDIFFATTDLNRCTFLIINCSNSHFIGIINE